VQRDQACGKRRGLVCDGFRLCSCVLHARRIACLDVLAVSKASRLAARSAKRGRDESEDEIESEDELSLKAPRRSSKRLRRHDDLDDETATAARMAPAPSRQADASSDGVPGLAAAPGDGVLTDDEEEEEEEEAAAARSDVKPAVASCDERCSGGGAPVTGVKAEPSTEAQAASSSGRRRRWTARGGAAAAVAAPAGDACAKRESLSVEDCERVREGAAALAARAETALTPEELVALRLPKPLAEGLCFKKYPLPELAAAESPADLLGRTARLFGLEHRGQIRFVSRQPKGATTPVVFAALLPCDHKELDKKLRALPAHLKGPEKNWTRTRKQDMGMAHVCMEAGCGRVFFTAMMGNLDGHARRHNGVVQTRVRKPVP